METYTLIYKDCGLIEKEHFQSYEDMCNYVNSYVDENIEVKVIKNTWQCVSQTPNIWRTPFEEL